MPNASNLKEYEFHVVAADFLKYVADGQINHAGEEDNRQKIKPLVNVRADFGKPGPDGWKSGKIDIYATDAGKELFDELNLSKFANTAKHLVSGWKIAGVPTAKGLLEPHALLKVDKHNGFILNMINRIAGDKDQGRNLGWLLPRNNKHGDHYIIDSCFTANPFGDNIDDTKLAVRGEKAIGLVLKDALGIEPAQAMARA